MADITQEAFELLEKSIECYKKDIENYPESEKGSRKPRKLKDLKNRLSQLEKQARNST